MTLTPEWCEEHHDLIQDTYYELLDTLVFPAPGTSHMLLSSTPDGRTISTLVEVDRQCHADEVSDSKALMYMAASVIAGEKMPFILRSAEDGATTVRMWIYDGKEFEALSAEQAATMNERSARTDAAWPIMLDQRPKLAMS